MYHIITKHITVIALLACAAMPLHAQEDAEDGSFGDETEEVVGDDIKGTVFLSRYKMGNGLQIVDGNDSRLTLSGLVQTTVTTRHYEDIDQQYNRFRIRRARLRLDGSSLRGRLRYRLGLDMVKGSETDDAGAGSLLQDAWLAYRPWGDGRLQISFGQRATPTDNLELSMSSHTLSFVERSKITSAFSTIREVGLFVESSHKVGHTKGVLRPSIAITDGDGPISGGKRYGGMKYGARLNYLPLGTFRNYGQSRESDIAYEFTPKLCIGMAYSYNQGTSDRRGGRSSGDILYMDARNRYRLPDMSKLVADISFKYQGFSLLAEFAKTWAHVSSDITQRVRTAGTTSTDFAVDGVQDVDAYIRNRMMLGWGYNIQAGYMFRSLWSIDARYTHLEADRYSYMNNDLYNNRPDFADLSITRYLTRSYASKIQLTVGWARTNGQCRTPDSRYYDGSEWSAAMMFQFKF
ncbi:MAG: porin [Prevotella sp.]|nr:porin [Prevotella sp.]